jgi:S-(hydroxymethyl)glutathione dehydrogenase/alcohol dehydrogenase
VRGILFTGAEAELSDRLEVAEPGPDELVVRIEAAGVCHSDLSVVEGKFGGLVPTPFVMGHEGAGVVEAVGSQVATAAVGDHVVLSTIDSCGRCAVCSTGRPTLCQHSRLGRAIARRTLTGEDPRPGDLPTPFRLDGRPICGFANTGVFTERVVVREVQAVAIDPRVPFTSACLIGCAVVTGTGAVFNRARVERGDAVAVIGVGGIGLNVIQACRIAGATRIVAIDANPAKEQHARHFGATDFVDAAAGDPVGAVQRIVPGGVRHAFECVGAEPTMLAAVDMTAPGGQIVILGVMRQDATIALNPYKLYQDKSLLGCRYGSSRVADDIPRLVSLYLEGRLLLDELVSATYPLDGLDRAFADLEAGRLARGVLIPR